MRRSSRAATPSSGSTDELALPETLQGIIAARLDGLPQAEKGLLQDAAVVGKVFWSSAIGRDTEASRTAALARTEGVRATSAALVARG